MGKQMKCGIVNKTLLTFEELNTQIQAVLRWSWRCVTNRYLLAERNQIVAANAMLLI